MQLLKVGEDPAEEDVIASEELLAQDDNPSILHVSTVDDEERLEQEDTQPPCAPPASPNVEIVPDPDPPVPDPANPSFQEDVEIEDDSRREGVRREYNRHDGEAELGEAQQSVEIGEEEMNAETSEARRRRKAQQTQQTQTADTGTDEVDSDDAASVEFVSERLVPQDWEEYVIGPFSFVASYKSDEYSTPRRIRLKPEENVLGLILEYILNIHVSKTRPTALPTEYPLFDRKDEMDIYLGRLLNGTVIDGSVIIRNDASKYTNFNNFRSHWCFIARIEALGTALTALATNLDAARLHLECSISYHAHAGLQPSNGVPRPLALLKLRLDIVTSDNTMRASGIGPEVIQHAKASRLCVAQIICKFKGKQAVSIPFLTYLKATSIIYNPEDPGVAEGKSLSFVISDSVREILHDQSKEIPGPYSMFPVEGSGTDYNDHAIHIVPLENFSGQVRMHKSLYKLDAIPPDAQKRLCDIESSLECESPAHDSTEEYVKEAEHITKRYFAELPAQSSEDAGIDAGCLRYIRYVKEMDGINRSQMHAVRETLRGIGCGHPRSSSLSLMQGPPGTGKSSTIIVLIGALLHHSRYGHAVRRQVNHRRVVDRLWRHCGDSRSFQILVSASSNKAAGLLLRNLREEGVFDMKGGTLYPFTVRLYSRHAVQEAEHGGKENIYSYVTEACKYDKEIIHPTSPGPSHPSRHAKDMLAREVVVLVTTTAMLSSAEFRDLNIRADIHISDEAGQTGEPEELTGRACTAAMNVYGRQHTVLVGDPFQLPCQSHFKTWLDRMDTRHVPNRNELVRRYQVQMRSCLERLSRRKGETMHLLNKKYRMQKTIGYFHSSIFYESKVEQGTLQRPLEPYNCGPSDARREQSGSDPWYAEPWFPPCVVIDTSSIPLEDSGEELYNNVDHQLCNRLEKDIVFRVLDDVHELRRDISGSNFVLENTAVLTFYKGQQKMLQNAFAHERNGRWRGIAVHSVDSIQGSQAEIVILSCVRANADSSVGFLKNKNRVNVAVSRARNLLVVICHSETFRPRSMSAETCLGLVLTWGRTRGSEMVLCSLFGITASVCSLFLRFGRRILIRILRSDIHAAVRMPTEEESESYKLAMAEEYPFLANVFAAADGLKIRLAQAGDCVIQNMFYNGWTHDHYVSNVFVFVPSGVIVACCINAPGPWHDSQIADFGGVYDKLQQKFIKNGGQCVVDAAFSKGDYPFLIKSVQDHLLLSSNMTEITAARQATSLRSRRCERRQLHESFSNASRSS